MQFRSNNFCNEAVATKQIYLLPRMMADGKRTSTGDCDNNVVLDAKEENGQHQKECRNIEDPYIEAVGYLEEHKILEIFQVERQTSVKVLLKIFSQTQCSIVNVIGTTNFSNTEKF